MTNKILLKFAKKGINLSPEAYYKIMKLDNPLDFSSNLIIKLKNNNKYSSKDLLSVNEKIVDELIESLNLKISDEKPNTTTKNTEEKQTKPTTKNTEEKQTKPKNSLDKFSKSSISTVNQKNSIIEQSSETVVNNPDIKFKRNINKTNVKYDFEILQDTSNKSYGSGELQDFVSYFKSRYEKLSDILSKRPELKTYQKISEINDAQENVSLILMVKEIRPPTKNGHRIIEFEDDTGTISILFSKNNEELFKESEKLVEDEIVGVIAQLSKDNKNGHFGFANELIKPGVPRIAKKEMDFGIVLLSDIHIGSKKFLDDSFSKFIDWINCDYGTEEQRKIASEIKYLIIGGDIVDGIGVYPGQDQDLKPEFMDITLQYNEAARYLGNIRSDVKIIIAPGNHDASRVAEPQPAVPEKYAKALYELNNVEFISNPGLVSLDGIKVLIYHGAGYLDLMKAYGYANDPDGKIMEELLKMRHLAPMYGKQTPLSSEIEDYLVIEDVPDIFLTAHTHINVYKNYNGIHLINSGTFQTQTDYQKRFNINPTPAEVAVIHRGTYKHLKFI